MENQSLEKIVNESHQRLMTPEKKGRGRPAGTTKTTNQTTQKTYQTNQTSEPRTSLGLKPTFGFLYEFGGKALATSSDCKDFELDKNESDALAQQSDDLMIEFFPTVQSKWVKLVIFIGSLLGIFGKKYLSYLEKIKSKKPASPENDYPVQEAHKIIQGDFPSKQSEAFGINPNKRF